MIRTATLVTLSLLLFSLQALAVPPYLSHQGKISQSNENPVTGSVNTTFKLYTNATGGSAVWEQTLAVTFDGGYYSIILDPGDYENTDIFNNEDLFLGITLEGQAEFLPRHRVTSVPYAIRAGSVFGLVNATGGLYVDGQELVDGDGKLTTDSMDVTSSLMIPRGTVDDLPDASEDNQGSIYFATDENTIYYSTGSEWTTLSGGGSEFVEAPVISSLSPQQIEPQTDVEVTLNGQRFEDGCEVELDGTLAAVTFVNSTQVTINTGSELDSGTYSVRLINPVGLRNTFDNGLVVDGSPEWVTSEGSLGFVVDAVDRDHFTLEATDPEGQEITYALVSGTIPPGLVLNSETGVISGDADDVEDDETYNFTISATDTAPTPNVVERDFSALLTHLLGQDAQAPGETCQQILDSGSSLGDDLYWIDPNGGDHSDSVQVLCDMTLAGGGWTALAANGENASHESTDPNDCYPLITNDSSRGCGNSADILSDFTVPGNQQAAISWRYMLAIGYSSSGYSDKLSYFGIDFGSAQNTTEERNGGSNYTPSGLSTTNGRMYCTSASYIAHYCKAGTYNNNSSYVANDVGTIFGHNTVSNMSSTSRLTFGFTDYNSTSSYQGKGIDDYQDGWSCSDQWTPQAVRGERMMLLVK